MERKKIAVLGSTGSIGKQTLNVVKKHPDKYQVVALTAHRDIQLAIQQATEFHPKFVGMAGLTPQKLHENLLPDQVWWDAGADALIHGIEATQPDMVVLSALAPWRRPGPSAWKRASTWRWPTKRPWCAAENTCAS